MSLKPPKKSDRTRNWMKPRKDRNIRIQPEYHLIVTEGTETEPAYFEAIKTHINSCFPGRIQMEIHGEGDNTVSLFEKARRLVQESANIYKHVWVVYDTDDFPPENINKTAILCENATNSETHYHAIWSNQCIELWFLLHFSFFHSNIHRSEYMTKLSKILNGLGRGKYSKNREDMFEIIRPNMSQAIANAERLDEMNTGKTPATSAPGTKLHEFIKTLQPYL